MSYVTGISGNVISAASAGYAPTNSAEVSAIASAYATGSEQVVTSLQYATSESATVASTVTADTAVGYGAKDISAEYYDYGYSPWTDYDSSKPLVQVRMTAEGNMRNYSSYPYYLYLVPYGATNNGNASTTSQLTDALSFGEFSGGMNDLIIAEGTGSSIDPYSVEVTFDVTSVPFWGSEPAYWGTVTGEHYAVVDHDEYSKPVFCVAGGYDGSQLFELRSNVTAELDFGSLVTVSAVSGINELEIYTTGGGGADTSAVSAIASTYANSAVSGVSNTVYSNSARWNNAVQYSAFTGTNGLVTGVVSGLGWASSVSGLMGVGSAFKESTGVIDTAQDTAVVTADFGYGASITFSGTANDPTRIEYINTAGSMNNAIVYHDSIAIARDVSGIVTASSLLGYGYDFGVTYTALSPEALAFQNDLPYYSYDSNSAISAINGSAIGGAGGIDSATCSAIASAYAESAVSSVSGNYYTTANESGYALSSDVSGTVDLVSTQSANWGGSALALSAGPGVKLEKVGDTLVAGLDRTLLWSGTRNLSATGTWALSGNPFDYEQVQIWARPHNTHKSELGCTVMPNLDSNSVTDVCIMGVQDALTHVRFNIANLRIDSSGFYVNSSKQISVPDTTANTPTIVTMVYGLNFMAEA